MPNNRRFSRVDRGLQRHLRSGELWFVGRQGNKVVWQRLRTADLGIARAKVAMLSSNMNGNTAVYLIVDGNERLIPEVVPTTPDKPLPRVRQVLVEANDPAPTAPSPSLPVITSPVPDTAPPLESFILRWRRGRNGLKPATERKLDDYLTILHRYVETQRPVSDYRPQDIRDYLAGARADKDSQNRRRLKGQTINEAIYRTLNSAFELALEERCIERNPMASVKRELTEPINRNQHTWDEAERILVDVRSRAPESYRELKFMLLLGVGQAEAKDIEGGSVKWDESQITFVRRKTGKQYTVPIYPWAVDFIRSEIEPKLRHGKPVFDWRNPRKALETSCRKLGVANLEIRSLRRTLILHLIQQGVDIRLIAKWQGHQDADLILKRYGAYIDAAHEKRELAKLNATG